MFMPDCTERQQNSSVQDLARLKMNTDSPDYADYLLFVVYETIAANSNVTLTSLVSLLTNVCMYDDSKVRAAISALTNDYGAVWRREIKNRYGKQPTHLTAKRVSPALFTNWRNDTLARFPELTAFVPLKVRK